MTKRIISLLLCISMLMSFVMPVLPLKGSAEETAPTVEAAEETIRILKDGEEISELILPSDEKYILTAEVSAVEEVSYQWQILMDIENNVWVNIYDKTEAVCEVSYPMVERMMDEQCGAYIRCSASCEGNVLYSQPVYVVVEPALSPEGGIADVEMILVSDLEVIFPEDDTEPVEEPSEPTEEATEPTEETTAPTEEPAEPSDEPTAETVEPTEETTQETVQPTEEITEPTEETTVGSEEATDPVEASSAPLEDPSEATDESGKPLLASLLSLFALEASAEENEGETDSQEYVTITIHYLDYETYVTDNEYASVYSPYTARIEKDSQFKQTVISPTYLGFAPYWDGIIRDTNGNIVDAKLDADSDKEIDENAASIIFGLDTVSQDLVINVFYKAIEVNFAVRYYFQNINDDMYTEDPSMYTVSKAITGTIITDDQLKTFAIAKNPNVFEGFSMMYHIPDAVAADGSTVFEVYLDRTYYLIMFDLDGGYGVDPIYARFGTPIVINEPIKYGYGFDGWDLLYLDSDHDGNVDTGNGEKDEVPSSMQAIDKQYYKALWKEIETSYSVVYWKENADDNGYSYWGSETKYAISNDTVNGEDTVPASVTTNSAGVNERSYFEYNSVLTDKNVVVASDGSTVVNVYYTRKYYTITFKAKALCTIPENHVHGDTCYNYICVGSEHTHTEDCLICEQEVHIHNEDCCTKTEHVHNSSCCAIPLHTHSNACCTKEPHVQHDNSCCAIEVHTQHDYLCCTKEEHSHSYTCMFGYRCSKTEHTHGDGSCTCAKTIHTHNDGTCSCTKEIHTHGDGNCTCSQLVHNHTSGCNTENCSNNGIVHTHGDGSCFCEEPAHQHDGSCYSCAAGEHTHTDACKRLICGIPTGHQHGNTCKNSSNTNTVKILRRKYQQSLADIWPITDDNGHSYSNGERWDPSNTSLYDEVLVYISTMPPDDFTLSESNSSSSAKTMNYYLQVLPGETYNKTYDGMNFKLDNTIKAKYTFITEKEDFFPIKGYDNYESNPAFNNNGEIRNQSTVDFYYTRSLYKLEFSNNDIDMPEKTQNGIMYGASLKEYYFKPDEPANLEPNAYEFEGWYTTKGCFDGTKVDWNTSTMPDGNQKFYANWVPNTHAVRFFTTYQDMLNHEAGQTVTTHATFDDITHGNVVGSVKDPENTDTTLSFGGWFFMENGQKKAFPPTNFPIKKDMNIFADWTSKSPQPYRIEYVLFDRFDSNGNPVAKKDSNGNPIKVADNSEGQAYYGTTRTFPAKAGSYYNQLYTDPINYNEGYFPTVDSHSITIGYEEPGTTPTTAKVNIYTFYYVKAEELSYTVRYLDAETGLPVVNPETGLPVEADTFTTTEAVVTARFKPVPDMVPDGFYKRLVLTVELDEDTGKFVSSKNNIIDFYYTKNKTTAFYAVHFMLEKLGATEAQKQNFAIDGTGGYVETGVTFEGTADVDDAVPIAPRTFAGFALLPDKAIEVQWDEPDSSGNQSYAEDSLPLGSDGKYALNVTQYGSELYIFYKRLHFPYAVHYYKYNTTEPVDPIKHSSKLFLESSQLAPYESKVTETAPTISGFTCVNAATQTITIREEKDTDNNGFEKEEITQNVIIFYYAETQYTVEYISVPETGGTLSSTIEVITGAGDFAGSTAEANQYYKFDGWYLDEACTQKVESGTKATISDDGATLIPIKEQMNANSKNIFYAKFVTASGNLTIMRSNVTEDENQVFVYEVKNNTTNDKIYVTVTGNGEVTIHDLVFGTYTVTQMNDWSWRYIDPAQAEISHNDPNGTTVQFSQSHSERQWLNGHSTPMKNKKKKEGEEDA